ncbi:MAG: response regulator [Parcubacteria group bacterium]|jgi:DNA-binding response OmpR family regulator|nr:response regulator [Parcubacteria group bacterium]|tara:strand:+ start:1327 stop:1713 length:387 start_codon:yes stop_codon:yes gene_type:complete
MKIILFIEDEPNLQKLVGRFLEEEGYRAISALNGEIGLQLTKKMKPDLILLDLITPKKDGFEVLQELKKDEATKDIPVIILTNLEGSADVEKALSLGATTYLVKANYELNEVVKKIKDTLKHSSKPKE